MKDLDKKGVSHMDADIFNFYASKGWIRLIQKFFI